MTIEPHDAPTNGVECAPDIPSENDPDGVPAPEFALGVIGPIVQYRKTQR